MMATTTRSSISVKAFRFINLIKTYGFSEHDAKVKVMQDFDEVKEDFEMKEMK